MVNKNERSEIHFYSYFGLFSETIFKEKKTCTYFMLVKKTVSMVNIKSLEHRENFLEVRKLQRNDKTAIK